MKPALRGTETLTHCDCPLMYNDNVLHTQLARRIEQTETSDLIILELTTNSTWAWHRIILPGERDGERQKRTR